MTGKISGWRTTSRLPGVRGMGQLPPWTRTKDPFLGRPTGLKGSCPPLPHPVGGCLPQLPLTLVSLLLCQQGVSRDATALPHSQVTAGGGCCPQRNMQTQRGDRCFQAGEDRDACLLTAQHSTAQGHPAQQPSATRAHSPPAFIP